MVLDEPAGDVRQVASDAGYLNLRAWPSTQSDIVTEIANDARVSVSRCDIEDHNGTWCKVQFEGQDGWVAARYLAPAQ